MSDVAGKDRFAEFENLGDAQAFVERILGVIEHIQLFEGFTREEVAVFARYLQCYRAPLGSQVIREGDSGDFMLLLIDGSMEIVKKSLGGLPARIGTADPGKTLGEMSLIDGEPRFASCITLEECLFAVLDRDSLTRIVTEAPALGVKILMEFLMLLNQRLRNVSGQLMRCMEDRKLRRT